MVRPEQVQAIVDWVADSGASSFTVSPTQSSAERSELAPAAHAHQSFTSPPCKAAKQSELQVMQQTLMLFDDSAGRVSPGHPYRHASEVEDIECTDAQPLMLQDEDMGGPPQHVSDDDETQVPTAAAFKAI